MNVDVTFLTFPDNRSSQIYKVHDKWSAHFFQAGIMPAGSKPRLENKVWCGSVAKAGIHTQRV